MKLHLIATVTFMTCTASNASTIEDELKTAEVLARSYCVTLSKNTSEVESCTKVQIIGAYTLAVRKSEDTSLTDARLLDCFTDAGEVHTGGANFVAVLTCLDD